MTRVFHTNRARSSLDQANEKTESGGKGRKVEKRKEISPEPRLLPMRGNYEVIFVLIIRLIESKQKTRRGREDRGGLKTRNPKRRGMKLGQKRGEYEE